MPDSPADPDLNPPEEMHDLIAELEELTRRSRLELGKMSEIEARAREISFRIARMTPPPDPSAVRDEE